MKRGCTTFRCASLVSVALLQIACSSDAPSDAGRYQPAAPTSTEETSAIAEVALKATPNATCQLVPGRARDGHKPLPVHADSEGIVRFYARQARVDDPAAVVSMYCGEPDRMALIRTVDRRDPSVFNTRDDLEPVPSQIRRIRAALTPTEIESISTEQLLLGGYPPRPDMKSQPDRYAQWVEHVSRPARVLTPQVVDRPDVEAGPMSAHAGSTWTGTVLTNRGPYLLTNVTFTVPSVRTDKAGAMVIWGGMGGYGAQVDSALIQNGVAINVSGGVATYAAFYEYWRNLGKFVSNFVVKPGDVLESWAYPTDDNENWNGVGIRGCFGFNNHTRGTVVEKVCMKTNSGNPPFTGATADFILEPQASFVPDFGTLIMTGSAWAAGGRAADTSTDPYTLIWLVNSTGGVRTQITNLTATQFRLVWVSGQW